jgi:hypothetical protein
MNYYLIRQKSTGLFMHTAKQGRSYSHYKFIDEEQTRPVRLFVRKAHGQLALDRWLKGPVSATWEGKLIKRNHDVSRNPLDYEVISCVVTPTEFAL